MIELASKKLITAMAVTGVLLVSVGAAQPACSSWMPRERAAAGVEALIDCTAPARASVVAGLGKALIAYALKYVSGDGRTVDLAQLKADAKVLKGEAVGSCALAAALAALATPPPESARSSVAPAPAPDPSAWRQALDAIRAELGVGAVKAAT